MSKLLVKISPGGKVQLVEDGRLDLTTLGKVVSRRRLGSIEPCLEDPAYLEVTMMDKVEGDSMVVPRKIGKKHKLKKDAIEAETDEARKLLKGELKEVMEASSKEPPPSTGGMMIVRCPMCRGPLHPETITTGQIGTPKATSVIFQCLCTQETDNVERSRK